MLLRMLWTLLLMLIGVVILALLLLWLGPATAQPRDKGEWFKSLKQPGSGGSCCDIADCKKTEADWRDGRWWAVVQGTWVAIPENTIVTKQYSYDGDAYVCHAPNSRIYCFIRPDMST